jgi:hypothetical protein
MLRCVQKEGKVFFAFGSKIKFRPQQSKSYTDKGPGKEILQGMRKFT